MEELLTLIREAAGSSVWSTAVQLSRDDAVVGDTVNDDEIVLWVKAPQPPKRYQVVLYPEDQDWSCTCSSTAEACEHVAAGIIALRQAARSGKKLPGGNNTGRVHYRFFSNGDRLELQRVWVFDDGREESWRKSLATEVTRSDVVVTDEDVSIDRTLGSKSGGVFPRGVLAKVLPRLVGLPTVLDGSPIHIGEPHPGLRAKVESVPEGVRVRLEADSNTTRIFSNGVLLIRDTLHPLKELGLEGGLLDALRRGKIYTHEELPTVTSELIPKLKRSLPLDAPDTLLPQAARERPRIEFFTEVRGTRVDVIPRLVYGDPPVARIDGTRLKLIGDGPAPVRDAKRESTLLTRLRAELGLEPGKKISVTPRHALALGQQLRETHLALAGSQRDFSIWGSLTPEVEFSDASGPQLQARFSTGQGRYADGRAVLEAWLAGEDHVPLIDGGFGELPQDWLERHGHRLNDLLGSQSADGTLPHACRLEASLLLESVDGPTPETLHTLRKQLDGPIDMPSDVKATLRPYQQEGVRWLAGLQVAKLGALLADDMGLGKTLQTICVFKTPTLVIAPTSVLENWRKEIEKFRPSLSVNMYHGSNRELNDADITLTTYAILRLDVEHLVSKRWKVLVLDEAQAIKNSNAQTARAAFKLDAEFRVSLTGTPVENRLDELWSQMHFLNPGFLGNTSDFQERYDKPIASGDIQAGARLRGRLRPFLKRRLKKDVATDLPPRTDLVLHCELSEEERALYDAVRLTTVKEVVAKFGQGASPLAALEALLRLRQAACHPALLPEQTAPTSAKLQLLMTALDDALASSHKALVFSQWTSMLDLVEAQLEDQRFLRLDGSTRDRGAVVDAFQSDTGPELLLISLQAGGTGLNLTAADYVFLLDPWWNPSVEDQAADRAHRIGQEKPVFVHRLVARDTVEEKILALQEKKRALAEAAVGSGRFQAPLTQDELLELLS